MRAEGDILSSGSGAARSGGAGGLVWMVDGDERPFEDIPAEVRPWLEESSDWASEGRSSEDEKPPAEPPASDSLVWL